jgi:hypothetical protein
MLTSPAGDKPADQKSIKKAVDAGAAPNSDWKGFVEKNPDVPRERVQQGGVLGASSDPPLWAVGLATLEKRAEEGDEGAIAQLRQYAGVGEGNAEMIVLPDGVESDNKASTDVNSPLGQQKRAFALYELAKLAGVAH